FVFTFCSAYLFFLFFFQCSRALRDLHSFPTRRSSDLRLRAVQQRVALIALLFWSVVDQHLHQFLLDGSDDPKHARDDLAGKVLEDRKSTRLNSSHVKISYAVFCLKKKKKKTIIHTQSS